MKVIVNIAWNGMNLIVMYVRNAVKKHVKVIAMDNNIPLARYR